MSELSTQPLALKQAGRIPAAPPQIAGVDLDGNRFGPLVTDSGVTFRLWAPSVDAVDLVMPDRAPIAMTPVGEGWFSHDATGIRPGQLYSFAANGLVVPDPASRQQWDDPAGWSVVRAAFDRPLSERVIRPWHETVLAEIHVATATPEGTYRSLADHLQHFADAGYTAIELMPIAEFPGRHNWGYDGVLPFSPESSYGSPEDLRALVDRAHALGLAVLLDVVYNHFGPIDNYIGHYAAPFFDETVHTPWGAGVNFAQPNVRRFFLENVRMWLADYDFDGLRFDAVHQFATDGAGLFMAELAAAARSVKPDALLVLENENNDPRWLVRGEDSRPQYFNAQWNDDIHHVLHLLATEQATGYYRNFSEARFEKATLALADGFIFGGEPIAPDAAPAELPPSAFVSFIQNHDQIGNQPDGRRLTDKLDAERLDFLHFVIMLSPQIPMFFMGEEAHLQSRFPFFGDLKGHLSDEIREGRLAQAAEFFETDDGVHDMPDPVDAATLDMAKLPWDEFGREERRNALNRFRQLAWLRREHVWPITASRFLGSETKQHETVSVIVWRYAAGTLAMVLNASPQAGEIHISAPDLAASTGRYSVAEDHLKLGPWSACLWLET